MTSYSHSLAYSAGALSLLVHMLFALALVFGVTWRNQPVGPAIAYLWDVLPPLPKVVLPPPKPNIVPQTAAKSEPKPAVPKPKAPTPLPKVEAPPKPDIQLQQEEARKRAEVERLEALRKQEAMRQEEERRRKEQEQRKAEEEKRKQDEKRSEEKRQEDKKHLEDIRRQEMVRQLEEEQKTLEVQRKKAREVALQQMERELARQMDEELIVEREQLRFTAASMARGKLVSDYQDKIRLKIRGLLRLPPLPKGNLEVIFKVGLLPNGEVDGRPVLVKSSGVAAYDYAVERAIVSASPLPMPPDKDVAALFREGLELKFRPED